MVVIVPPSTLWMLPLRSSPLSTGAGARAQPGVWPSPFLRAGSCRLDSLRGGLLDFDDLQALLWVHDHGSLKRASKATGVSRAALRRRLDRLDAAVERPIYIASPEGITLTASGHALVVAGRGLLAERQRVLDEVRGAWTSRKTLRVLLQQGLPPAAIAAAAALIIPTLPGVHVVVEQEADPAARQGDAFDAVLHWGESPAIRTGYTRTLAKITFGVLAAPAYLAQHGAPETPADLSQHQVLHLDGTEPRWRCLDGQVVELDPALTTGDLYLLGMLAGRGMGLALLPLRGPVIDEELAGLEALAGSMVHPTIEDLQPVLTEWIRVDRRLRLDMPVPSRSDNAAAMFLQVAAAFGQQLSEI